MVPLTSGVADRTANGLVARRPRWWFLWAIAASVVLLLTLVAIRSRIFSASPLPRPRMAASSQAVPVRLAVATFADTRENEQVTAAPRVQDRMLAKYPDREEYYPLSRYHHYPPEVRALIRREEMEHDQCAGSPGDDQDRLRACNRSGVIFAQVERKGWCWGGAGTESEKYWLRCRDDPTYRPSAGEKRTAEYSEAEIRRLPWEVATMPCPEAEAAGRPRPVSAERRCAEDGFAEEDRLLNTAYGKLMRLMAPQARVRLREEQRRWLRKRDRDAAQCAVSVVPPGVRRDAATIRCRTGLTAARKWKLEVLIPAPAEMGMQPR
jgi:uncharacterized protein YecT (DUF1311 family)